MRASPIPIPFTILLVAVSLILGEWFPFSKFPMYSVLPETDLYYYVADDADRAIPTTLQFGLSTRFLKKVYRSLWNRAQEPGRDEEAGVRLLRFLVRHRRPRVQEPAAYTELRLYRVTITRKGSGFSRDRALVARFAPGTPPA